MMTWGQLRLQLSTGAPGVSPDLIDEFLNTRYERVLAANEWRGIEAHATVQTTAAYQSTTDSVTLTVGSPIVTGAGTAWIAAQIGMQFYRPGDQVYYTASIGNANTLTLDRPFEGMGSEPVGTVYPLSAYVLMQNLYPLPANCSEILSIVDPVTGRGLQQFSSAELDRLTGPPTQVADPRCFAPYDDSPEASPPVLHQVEFYPPPLYARGMKVSYVFAALGFDGITTFTSPIPVVLSGVLLAGARADIAMHLEKPVQAGMYEASFGKILATMLLKEHRTRPGNTFKMASRFTRHRLARVERGTANDWRGGTPGGPD